MHKTKLLSYLFLIVTFVGVSIANGGELQKNGFSISIPDGWVEIPRYAIDEYEKGLAKLAPNVPASDYHYDYGFQLNSSKNWFEHPYILLQIKNFGRMSEKELESLQNYSLQGIKKIEDLKKDVSSRFNDLEFGKLVYDKQTKMLWLRTETNVADVGLVSGISGWIPTEKGAILVHGNSLKKDYPTYESVFQSVALSVIPEPGLAYKARWSDNLPPTVSGINWGKALGTGLGWFLMLSIIIAIKQHFKRKKVGNFCNYKEKDEDKGIF